MLHSQESVELKESSLTPVLTVKKNFVCLSFSLKYVCVICTNLMIKGVRRGPQIPWSWSYRSL